MTNEIATHLNDTNSQFAAETLPFKNGSGPKIPENGRLDSKIPIDGNSFIRSDLEIVEHISNTTTGFAGTLFRTLKDDPKGDIVAGGRVIRFCSVEFTDDAARDIQAAITREEHGWTHDQIADMEIWFQSLTHKGLLPPDAVYSITRHHPGGTLATTFKLLWPAAVDTSNGTCLMQAG